MKILVFPISQLELLLHGLNLGARIKRDQSVPHALGDNGQPKAEHYHRHDLMLLVCSWCEHSWFNYQLGGPVAKRMNRAQIGKKRAFI
jgi:hypothetical protein